MIYFCIETSIHTLTAGLMYLFVTDRLICILNPLKYRLIMTRKELKCTCIFTLICESEISIVKQNCCLVKNEDKKINLTSW